MPRTEKLTPLMKRELVRMLDNNWTAYRSNSTHIALEKHGYVARRRGRTYGKEHWSLTESGAVEARRLKEAKDFR